MCSTTEKDLCFNLHRDQVFNRGCLNLCLCLCLCLYLYLSLFFKFYLFFSFLFLSFYRPFSLTLIHTFFPTFYIFSLRHIIYVCLSLLLSFALATLFFSLSLHLFLQFFLSLSTFLFLSSSSLALLLPIPLPILSLSLSHYFFPYLPFLYSDIFLPLPLVTLIFLSRDIWIIQDVLQHLKQFILPSLPPSI